VRSITQNGPPPPTASSTTLSTCAGVAVSAGRAACTTRALAVGSHAIAATYSGDAGNAGSTSPTLTQVVSAGTSVNVALASNGGVASASSTFTLAGNSFDASALNDGERAGANWGHGGGWNDATFGSFPDWVQIRFSRSRTIDRVVAYTLQDSYGSPVEPSDTQAFTLYGITDFVVQAWTGSRWTNLVTVTGNHLVKRTATFPPTTTSRIRVRITGSVDGWSRLTEIEAWGT